MRLSSAGRLAGYAMVGAAAFLPRIIALFFVERSGFFTPLTEKSDRFAQTFLASGTFGFIPGEPSGYTQPLYGFFLVMLYWAFGRRAEVIGFAQAALAVATALLVYEVARRFLANRWAITAAFIATLSPYLIWEDIHVNREILDQLFAAAMVLVTLLAAERLTLLRAGLLGFIAGLAILGNVRLLALPLVLVAYLLWRRGPGRRSLGAAAIILTVCALTLAPSLVRNWVSVGCLTLTTDARALWKANNERTYSALAGGGWIDDVPNLPGYPPSPHDASFQYQNTGTVTKVDECAQMRFYRGLVYDYWWRHAGEKTRLSGLAAGMLWNPWGSSKQVDAADAFLIRAGGRWIYPIFLIVVYALALAGIATLPRTFVVFAASLLTYQTVLAMVFTGANRYRVPWDFLLAILAAAAIARLAARCPPRKTQ